MSDLDIKQYSLLCVMVLFSVCVLIIWKLWLPCCSLALNWTQFTELSFSFGFLKKNISPLYFFFLILGLILCSFINFPTIQGCGIYSFIFGLYLRWSLKELNPTAL